MNNEEEQYDEKELIATDDENSGYDPEEDLFYEDGLEDEGDLDYEPDYGDS